MTEEKSSTPSKRFDVRINPPVFFSSLVLIGVFVLIGVLAPEIAASRFGAMQTWVAEKAGWFYILAVAGFLVFSIWLASSRLGEVRLGKDHSKPDYSYVTWFAMLFSAGMGIGLMFFGVAEPVMHFLSPPQGEGGTVEAAREAMRITFFHWGVHAWAIYAVVALSLAYFSFRLGLPLTIRSAFYPLIGKKIYGPIGDAADTFAVLGTMFGVATSLGFGVIQVNSGLNYLLDVPISTGVQVGLVIVITGFASISVGLGLDGGIRRISEINVGVAALLLIFTLLVGPTFHLFEAFAQNTGHYIAGLVEATFHLYAYEPNDWIGGWTLFYWGWWIAWSPFVGMFIARVSRGRTIREFVVGVLFVPVGFTFLWMTVFGNTALYLILQEGVSSLGDAVSADTSVALFQFFENLPLTGIMTALATILVVTFFVTSSDSGSLVVDMLTSGGDAESPMWQRLFWASMEGVVAIALLLAGGLGALQAATIVSALPFTIVMIFMCWGLLKSLRVESARIGALNAMPPGGVVRGGWKGRLNHLVGRHKPADVEMFVTDEVKPALDAVREAFQKRGIASQVASEGGRCWVEVLHDDEVDFYYCVQPVAHEAPAFTLREFTDQSTKLPRFQRPEVFLKEGGLGYDVMGWSREDIINDVLDYYDRHLKFLAAIR